MGFNGWLVLDKPLCLSSTQAGSVVRRLLKIKKLGHLGTLDPMATGVLPLALGEATKTIPYYTIVQKTYDFEITWGEHRDTGDGEGKVLEMSSLRPDLATLDIILQKFIGNISQIPPLYSALKVNGKRACDLARAGQDVTLKARNVLIHSFDLKEIVNPDKASFRVVCGSGTYVRSLAIDLCKELGVLGYVSHLRRIQDGIFNLSDTISLEKLKEIAHKSEVYQHVKPIGTVLDDIPAVTVSEAEIQELRQGKKIPFRDNNCPLVGVWNCKELVAMAELDEGYLYPKRIIHN